MGQQEAMPSRNQDSIESLRLVSFADSRLWRSVERLRNQAENLGLFSSIDIFTEVSLDTTSTKQLRDLLKPELKGFGYWAWKPAVILESLKNSVEGDLLLYVDVGCHLNPKGSGRLDHYFETVRNANLGIVGFQAYPPMGSPIWDGRWIPSFPDAQWAKGDLLDHFEVRGRADIIETPTLGAGVILVRNCEGAKSFLEEWLHIMVENIALVDDSPSTTDNHPWFIENRHDQAVFSLLAKTRGIPVLSAFEYWYPRPNSRKADWIALAKNPVHARRDLDFGPYAKIATLLRRFARRFGRILARGLRY